VRRFFCDHPGCGRRIFTERLPETAASYARRTRRAARALEAIGFAVGGRPGERLARALGLLGGAWAIRARVRAAPEPEWSTPRVLGVDDWALRRGQRYGTILLDLERHRVLDLLPDREAATLAAWLRAHPGVELISRDRSGAYSQGARLGAPEAIQIADRFHLVKNLMDALERACARHHAALQTAAVSTGPIPLPQAPVRQRRSSGLPHHHATLATAEQRITERRARRRARYERVVTLAAAGMTQSGIAKHTGMDRQTIRRWLGAGQFPERAPPPGRRHRGDPFLHDILDRYDAGLDNAAELARALWANGFRGSYQTVRRCLATLRRTRQRDDTQSGTRGPRVGVAGVAPSPRQTAWLLRNAAAKPDDLTSQERAYVAALTTACPALARAQALARAFGLMLTDKHPNGLAAWLAEAADSELASFAAGLQRDHDAVQGAVVFPWSNGQVEGHVHRLKLLKRTMYGRAGFALLRKRVLHAA
jgi:transposase